MTRKKETNVRIYTKMSGLFRAKPWIVAAALALGSLGGPSAFAQEPEQVAIQPLRFALPPTVKSSGRPSKHLLKHKPPVSVHAAPAVSKPTGPVYAPPNPPEIDPPVASTAPDLPADDGDPIPFPVRKASAIAAVSHRVAKPAGIPCHVVTVDLNNPHVRLRTLRASDLGTRYRSFGSFVRQTRPIAAITGTFFDTATGEICCNLVRDGQLLAAGVAGQTLSFDEKNEATFLQTAGQYGGARNWRNTEVAISSGPSLVQDGEICLSPSSEGFSDPGLFRMAARTGLAVTWQNKLLLVSVNRHVTLGKFAHMMKALGARYALNLDGGSSTALYAKGRYYSHPRRRLTNVLIVSVRPGDPLPHRVDLEPVAEAEAPLQQIDEAYEGSAPEAELVDMGVPVIVP